MARHSGYAIALVAACVLCPVAAWGDDGNSSLQPAYEKARQLAQESDGLDAAIAEYREIIETHLANEKAFQQSLRQLMAGYEAAGRAEDGIRFLMTIVDQIEQRNRSGPLRELFQNIRLKHPDLMKKVYEELHGSAPRQPASPAVTASGDLSQAILQRTDKQLREKSLERLQQMLAPDSSDATKRTALATLGKSLSAKFDREPFRPLVLPLLESEDEQIRMRAVGNLPALNATAADLSRVIPLAEDPSPQVRKQVASALIRIGQSKHAEQVIPALMKLLQDEDAQVVKQNIRSMWGQYTSPEFDELLIELSHDSQHHGITIYHALSTMPHKSPAVCRRLVEELDDPDWNNSGRAAWGLTYGVTDEAKSLVEEGLLRALPEETNPYTREQEFRALRGVATEKSRTFLKSVAESDLELDKFRQSAREILAGLDQQ